MKNILLLTDFTPKSDNAHHFAFQFFKGQDCTFHLLSIQKVWDFTMDDLMAANPKSSVDVALLKDNRSDLTTQLQTYKSIFKDSTFTFESHVDYDVFTDAVTQAVQNYNIDIIVCGTDGNSGILEAIFSSHTLRIINKVNCPVLVIPEHYKYQELEHIQYLLDYDDTFESCGKQLFDEVITRYSPKVSVHRLTFALEMQPESCDAESEVIQQLYPEVSLHYHVITSDDPIKELNAFVKEEGIQLQILSARRQTFLERFFSHSHLSKIVNSTEVPLLILCDCSDE